MDSPAQGITSEPVASPPATPPPAPPPVTLKKHKSNWPFVLLGIIIAFVLGIGFDHYHVASYISTIRLPKFSLKSAPKPTPLPKMTPVPTASPTAHWKTFVSSEMTFLYPPDWAIDGNLIATKSPKIRLVVIPKSSTLMNECMQQVGMTTLPDYVVRKFIRITTGEACATGDANPREIWVVPSANAFAPGISFSYSATEATQAGQLFTKLLNTFKFLHETASPSATPTASPSASKYKCPAGDYVDCMPILSPDKQAACTSEAMAWYKINCPNFKGGAL